jgi:hypothetical protein
VAEHNNAKEKLEGFVSKLESLGGYRMERLRKKPQIYFINGKFVNIRSRGKNKQKKMGVGHSGLVSLLASLKRLTG